MIQRLTQRLVSPFHCLLGNNDTPSCLPTNNINNSNGVPPIGGSTNEPLANEDASVTPIHVPAQQSCYKFSAKTDPLGIIGSKLLNSRYTVIEYIATGGIAEIYKVHDENQNIYAAKIFKSVDQRYLERFHEEQKAFHILNGDPNIITFIDSGEFMQRPVLIFEFADGGSLYDKQKNGDLTIGDALVYILHASNGLESVHRINLVHRDVKPHNILISNGVGKLSDFDLIIDEADIANSSSSLNGVTGTINYLAPELTAVAENDFDHRSDIYSLGVTMFHVLTGMVPFTGNLYDIIRKHVELPPPKPRTLNPDITKKLEELILKMMEKSQSSRPSIQEIQDTIVSELANKPELFNIKL